ncbi:major facilitator superfamily domain-containing protein [Linnemannia elongata]|nr:major facilitator superfamily domain-containing protein [Linnemannia elongata]
MGDTPISTTAPPPEKSHLPWYCRLNQMKGLLLALVSMAQMLDIINVASVTIALPNIQEEVGYSTDQLQWVTSAYALAYGAFLLIGGRFGDLFGHRRIYIFGVTWFSIWAIVNGFAKDPIIMSVGRALQGMGAGFTVPSALAILTTTYPVGPERTFALAVFGGTGAAGSVIGVLLGGILGSTIGWRWIFYLTAMLGFIMSFLGFIVTPASKGESKIIDRRIDFVGVSTFTIGIVCVIFYLSESPASGWASAKTLTPFLIGLVLLILFVFIEYKIDYPIMPLYIWKSRRLVASSLAIICVSAAANAMIFFSSLLFQNVLGYTPLNTSLTYIVYGVGAVVANIVVNKLLTKVRTKLIMLVCWVLFVASGVVFAQANEKTTYWEIPFPALILNFMGMAPVWLCCQINSVADADDEDQGVVGAVYNVAQQIGTPIGIAIANIVANNINSPTAKGAELLPGYRAAFYSCAVMAGVGLVVTILFAANSDPVRMYSSPAGEDRTMDEEAGPEKETSKVLKEGSLTSLENVGVQPGEKSEVEESSDQPGEKTELKT